MVVGILMMSIRALPETVHSSLRSTSFLFDLTRVIEELILNSLDAGAQKVSVFIGVANCYVKVADDGSGITRDGLMLLGERYTTSRLYNLDDMDTASRSFGFRGEALSSISDVSLLEIVTKAHGRPNGFRKVIKDCKCLYLGIDDDKQDVGTTVIVRDLFYNQPVRRKQMQSSPKKVLHSVKKCIVQIALVHSMVSFQVVDIESEEELLSTHALSSPLSLLMSDFGIDVSSLLHEVNLSEGELEVSGYVSGPCNTLSVKAFQYVYINSRIIQKGPIHKLVSQLATKFNCMETLKRSRPHTSPVYILSLCCPRSWYDFAFEPLKTYAEFKDWDKILNFIEKAIRHLWSGNIAIGESSSLEACKSKGDEIWKEDDIFVQEEVFASDVLENSKNARDGSIINHHFPSHSFDAMELITDDGDYRLSHRKDNRFPFKDLFLNTIHIKGQQNESSLLGNSHLSNCKSSFEQERLDLLWDLGDHSFFLKDNFSTRQYAAAERSNVLRSIFNPRVENQFHKVYVSPSNSSSGSGLYCDSVEFGNQIERVNRYLKTPFLQRCSFEQSLPADGALLSKNEESDYKIEGLRNKRKRLYPDGSVYAIESDGSNKRFESDGSNKRFESDGSNKRFGIRRSTPEEDEVSTQLLSRTKTKFVMHTDVDHLSTDSLRSSPFDGLPFHGENDLSTASTAGNESFGLDSNVEWGSITSSLLHGWTTWNAEGYAYKNACEWRNELSSISGDFTERKENDCILRDAFGTQSKKNPGTHCLNVGIDSEGVAGPKGQSDKFIQSLSPDDIFSPRCCAVLINGTGRLCSDSSAADDTTSSADLSLRLPSFAYHPEDENYKAHMQYQDEVQNNVCKERARRSLSAPPFCKVKKKFSAVMEPGRLYADTTLTVTSELENQKNPSVTCVNTMLSFAESSIHFGPQMKKMFNTTSDTNEIQTKNIVNESQCFQGCCVDLDERNQGCHVDLDKRYQVWPIDSDKGMERNQESVNPIGKWQFEIPPTKKEDKHHNFHDQCNILDISSGILHLSGHSLVPESISKNFLEDAKVLQQLGKKFIPIVAGGTLAVIDQHAADERIQLEKLQQKVLSEEVKTIRYLDAEQELVLPEIGYQLLHNYAEQIQNWGWIFNNLSQSSMPFSKNLNILHRRPAVIKLLAVPCILGVNLSDMDLLEFLQQLSDTDGSSMMPPSVLRVLNSKACRGAIMFGDTLLPSECSLVVEELKQTSLCFLCAHGRPTTVPLVNLEALHKQIARLGMSGSTDELWHGLQRQPLNLIRSAQRLNPARGQV